MRSQRFFQSAKSRDRFFGLFVVFVLLLTMTFGWVMPNAAPNPASAAGEICNNSSPSGQTYVIRVCITAPENGASLTGDSNITATATLVSGTSPGVAKLLFFLDGLHLLTDF